jgi:hypothetical protein
MIKYIVSLKIESFYGENDGGEKAVRRKILGY